MNEQNEESQKQYPNSQINKQPKAFPISNGISIILNGQKMEIEDKITLDQLVTNLGLSSKWVVIELNDKAVIKMDYDRTFLSNGDRIELVRAVSGG